MNNWYTNLILFVCFVTNGWAQCPEVQFSVPSTACINEPVSVENMSAGSDEEFFWDFCAGDLLSAPTGSSVLQVLASAGLTGVDVVEDQGQYYVFLTGRSGNNITRLDFGTSITNTSPTITDLGNIGDVMNAPVCLRVVQENGNWYGVVYNSGSDKLVRISFGTSLANSAPTAEEVIKGYGGLNNDIAIGYSNEQWVVAITSPSSNKLSLINFGSSLTNTPIDPDDIVTTEAFTGAGSLRGLSLMRVCDQWMGYATAYNGRKVYRLNFGSDLFTLPTITDITGSFSVTDNFQDIQVMYDAGTYIGFLLTYQGVVYQLDFGSDPTNVPIYTNLGNLGVIGSSLSFDFVKVNSNWYFFTGNLGTRYLYRADFPNDCSASQEFSSTYAADQISYSREGTYTVTLTHEDASGNSFYDTQTIVVQNLNAPTVTLDHEGICAANATQFSLIADITLSNTAWSFGDGGTSNTEEPAYTYATPGTYQVKVTVEASNGCVNYAVDTVVIYEQPVASFTMPTGVICTNNSYLFENNTIDDFDGYLTYQWTIDTEVVTTDRDLTYIFSTEGSKTISLAAAIPGCVDENTQSISSVDAGPDVDFSYTGSCEGDTYTFTNLTTGDDIINYQWTFEEGQTSTAFEPFYTFENYGEFQVSLQVNTSSGCQNTTTNTVTVYTKPDVSFSVALPPFSCSGTTSQFYDETSNPDDSNLTSWLWDFDDNLNVSSDQNPQYTYAEAGIYQVSLTVATNFGCEATLQEDVTIEETPIIEIDATPICQDVSVQFSTSSETTIASWNWQIESTIFTTATATYVFADPGSYNIQLNATAANGCIASVTKLVDVDEPLYPDFTYTKNCDAQETEFQDVTTVNDDLIAIYRWDFGNDNIGIGKNAFNTYYSTGTYSVTLNITTEQGCVYTTAQDVAVVSSPVASFTASPSAGVPPLSVQFTNTSIGATHYLWAFNDENNTTSTLVSPGATFVDYGNHVVDLTAYNALGCLASTSSIIVAQNAQIDISIDDFVLLENKDGTQSFVVRVANDGNITLQNIPLRINLSGTEVQETIDQLSAGTFVEYALGFTLIAGSTFEYICVKAVIEDDIDQTNNERCIAAGDAIHLFNPYPNPTSDELYLEWVANESELVSVQIIDALGRLYLETVHTTTVGFNQVMLSMENARQGVYYVCFKTDNVRKTYRINIQR